VVVVATQVYVEALWAIVNVIAPAPAPGALAESVVDAEIGPPYTGDVDTVGDDSDVVALVTDSPPVRELPEKLVSPEYVAVI
jgi:hypothetical protein